MLSQIDDTQIHGFDVLGCRYQQILVFQPQSAWDIGRKKYEKCNSIYFLLCKCWKHSQNT